MCIVSNKMHIGRTLFLITSILLRKDFYPWTNVHGNGGSSNRLAWISYLSCGKMMDFAIICDYGPIAIGITCPCQARQFFAIL